MTRVARFREDPNALLGDVQMEVHGEVLEANGKHNRRYRVTFTSGFLNGCDSTVDADDIVFTDGAS